MLDERITQPERFCESCSWFTLSNDCCNARSDVRSKDPKGTCGVWSALEWHKCARDVEAGKFERRGTLLKKIN